MARIACVLTVDDEAYALDSDASAIHHVILHDMLRLAKMGHSPAPDNSRLSGREWDCIRLLSQGMANKQIARQLGIALGTVKCHLATAFRVLGVQSRTQAAIAVCSMIASREMHHVE